MVRRTLGSVLRWAGILAFGFGLIISIPILLEGVTGLVGEGSLMRRETPEQIRARLTFVGELWSAAIAGWILARVGTSLSQPEAGPPISLSHLMMEALWLAGGLSVAVAALIAVAPRASAYETPEQYRRLMTMNAIVGPIFLFFGWIVWRFGSRPRALLIAACLLGIATSNAVAGDQPPTQKPNILLIVADDLGYGDLGCYGSKDIRTPNLDRLAADGVRLTDFYVSAPVCSPTRASLITARYPQRAGFDWVIRYKEKDRGLPVSETSIVGLMQKKGYATGLFGKWHLGYKPEFGPNAHGFDEFFGFLSADLDYYTHKDANGDPGLYHNEKLINEDGYLTDLITDRSAAFLKANANKPFFLEVAYNAPHWPFQVPDNPADGRTDKNYGPETGTRADYVRMVERMDQGIGKLLDALAASGHAKDTLVIFFSDNGGERLSDNGPLFHGKYSLWEGGIRVPCIMRWPGVVPTRSVSTQLAIVMDLLASMLAAAGVDPPAGRPLDGENILPILAGKKPPKERTFFWRLPRPDDQFGQKAVRRGKWKYVHDREMDMLFDLDRDVGERHNLSFEHPEIVNELREAIEKWESTLPATKK